MDNDEFNGLKRMYEKSLPGKLKDMQRALSALRQNADLEVLKELRLYVHRMAGSAGVYGYPSLSIVCKEWDQKLSEMILAFVERRKDGDWLKECDCFFATLQKEILHHG